MEMIFTNKDIERLLRSKFPNIKEISASVENKKLKVVVTLDDESFLDTVNKLGGSGTEPKINPGEQDERIKQYKDKFKDDTKKDGKESKPIKHPPKVATMHSGPDRENRTMSKL